MPNINEDSIDIVLSARSVLQQTLERRLWRLSLAASLALALCLMLAAPQSATACACAPPENTETDLKYSDTVFIGRALKLIDPPGRYNKYYEFEVEKNWKGSKSGKRVYVSAGDDHCGGWNFKIKESYLIYANGPHMLRNRTRKLLVLPSCRKEKLAKEHPVEIRILSALTNGSKPEWMYKTLPNLVLNGRDTLVIIDAIRQLAMVRYWKFPLEKKVEPFLKSLKSPDPRVRAAAAEAFNDDAYIHEKVETRGIVADLLPLIEEKHDAVRVAAIKALGNVGMHDERAARALVQGYEKFQLKSIPKANDQDTYYQYQEEKYAYWNALKNSQISFAKKAFKEMGLQPE